MKSTSLSWTKHFFTKTCPCGSRKKAYHCCWRGNGCWETTPVGVIAIKETPYVNERCYLSPLGNCSRTITREHFISKNILKRIAWGKETPGIATPTLKFEGARHFFGGKECLEIGINAFAAKVLCDKHNSALSLIDTAVGLAFETIEALAEDAAKLHKGGSLLSFDISSGLDIERWMIKVFCGLIAAGKIKGISGQAAKRSCLQRYLLDALLGSKAVPEPLGLYMHTFAGQERKGASRSGR